MLSADVGVICCWAQRLGGITSSGGHGFRLRYAGLEGRHWAAGCSVLPSIQYSVFTHAPMRTSRSAQAENHGLRTFVQGHAASNERNSLDMYDNAPTYIEPRAEVCGDSHGSIFFSLMGIAPLPAACAAPRHVQLSVEVFA